MPELPEVETVVRTLTPLLVGRAVWRVSHARPDILNPPGVALDRELAGRTITRIDRRGKRILIRLDNDTTLYVHLGMTGRLTVEPGCEQCKPHTHLIVDLAGDAGVQLRFRDPRRFGGVWLLPMGDRGESGMGPEPLTMKPKELARRLSCTTRAIKVALLDQQLIAGIGNIYADEALHASGIHPTTPANRLTQDQAARLCRAIKAVLKKAINHRGSSLRDYVDATGQPGAAQKLHLVYDRAGAPCQTCRASIVRIVLGGRSTHFCPRCQVPEASIRSKAQKPGPKAARKPERPAARPSGPVRG